MSVAGPFTLTHELDQMLVQYRKHLLRLGPLWTQASDLGRCGNLVMSPRSADDILNRLELAVSCLMEKGVQVERARQEVFDLKASLDISRQTVEAKSKHLGQEEKQKEEEQSLRFKEFKRIHRFQDEKVALEKDLVPAKRRLSQIAEVLDDKGEKMRNLEVSQKNFYDLLSEHCDLGMNQIRQQTEMARSDRAKWDKLDLDIGTEVREFPLDPDCLAKLEQDVCDLNNMIKHHKQWYEEEMQTKLFYSTRSKEIKHKLAYYRSLLRRMESNGRSEDLEEDAEGRRLSRRSENILVDGSPGVQAKEVESYLSRQFGMRVLADYTMLKRLKDEIGVQGLAYLVEKVRLQGGSTPSGINAGAGIVTSAPAFADWEEQRVEQALMGIAMEYRDSEEGKRLLRPYSQQTICSSAPPATPSASLASSSQRSSTLTSSQQQIPEPAPPASSLNSPTSAASVASSGSRGSSSSLRRKSSLARIRKLFRI